MRKREGTGEDGLTSARFPGAGNVGQGENAPAQAKLERGTLDGEGALELIPLRD